jgi:hypothetical protein
LTDQGARFDVDFEKPASFMGPMLSRSGEAAGGRYRWFQFSERTRCAAIASGAFVLIQSRLRPGPIVESARLETIPPVGCLEIETHGGQQEQLTLLG